MKYGNKKTVCFSSHFHDSKKEASYCDVLLAMKKNKEILDYEVYKTFTLQEGFVNSQGKKVRPMTYTPDFFVTHTGHNEFIDVKGGKATQTQSFNLKWKLLQFKYREKGLYVFTII
jgi:hypothetical protein